MLRPLLCLFFLISLTGASVRIPITQDQAVNISLCPITYYGNVYSMFYVNVTESNLVLCFDDFYDTSASQDCILSPPPDDNTTYANVMRSNSPYDEQHAKTMAPTLTGTMDCFVAIYYTHEAKYMVLVVLGLGNETALGLFFGNNEPFNKSVDIYVEGHLSNTVETNLSLSYNYVDVSGCRAFGRGYSPIGLHHDNENCANVTCDLDRSPTISSFCTDGQTCDGDGSCSNVIKNDIKNHMCTVTGPAVIDIYNNLNTIENRCAYTLVGETWAQGFSIIAHFRERRRKDVSFVDSVTLRTAAADIVLGQGGKVLVNGSLLALDSSAQNVNGVELYKDQTGVHANVSAFGRLASVFFDGDTAQIQIELSVDGSLDGLCGNSSSFITSKNISDSPSNCDTPQSEAADTTIQCDVVQEGCNVLQGGPFSSCNAVVDPTPYITACSETLCTYSSVDGLRCQFIWAYARACSLSDAMLGDWWTPSECPTPEAFCQDQNCAAHEFCGKKSNGDTSCFCRAVFASTYEDSNTLGDPTVCSQNSASVSLVGCLLEEKNIDYSLLHLKDKTCTGVMDPDSHMVTFSFDSSNLCGSVITSNETQVIYENAIMTQNTSDDVITRQHQVYIEFSCINVQPEMKTVAFRIQDSSVVQQLTSGDMSYTLTMTAYTDAGLTHAVDSNTNVVLNQKIWVQVDTQGLDANTIAVVMDSCWATAQASSTSSPRYNLIQNGCANNADQTVALQGNGNGTSNQFSFNMFQFVGESSEVYLHCELSLCVKEGSSCIPNCSSLSRIRRRSIIDRRRPSTIISMAWIN